jgi:hypothetical protein
VPPTYRKLLVLAAFEALVIAGASCFWYAPLWRRSVEPASVEIIGFRRLPKEGQIKEFSSLAALDSELGGTTNYRLPSPVDFSRQKLVRVGWVPQHTSGGKLQHTVRFGGLIVLFDVDAWRRDTSGAFHPAEDAWFVVPRPATMVAATREEVGRKDALVWIGLAAPASLIFVWQSRDLRRSRRGRREHLETVNSLTESPELLPLGTGRT